MKLPRELGPIHFIGVGGIGMSGIADVLDNLGYRVQGAHATDSANVKRLRDKGATVFIGHDAAHIGDAEVVVVSTAIRRDNPELAAAREKRLPVVRRAEMLAELMRLKQCVAIAGTHGKTTTTSLVATLLDAGGFDPTVINGGIINAYGTNARLGAGDWMVVEADESDGTFLKLPADVAIITNIDPEHLDHFKTFDAIKAAFLSFIENLPFYGFAVMCLDHPTVQELVGRIEDRRVITYGENPQADVRLMDVDLTGGVTRFNVLIRDRKTAVTAAYLEESGHADARPSQCPQCDGRHRGRYRTQGVEAATIRRALAGFGGVKRRFTRAGDLERGGDLRRLRPSSGRDCRRAARRARCRDQPCRRHRAAASLHAPRRAFQRLRHLFQRCRCRHHRRCLCGRRNADPGRLARRSRRGGEGTRPSQRHGARKPRPARGAGRRHRAAGRLHRLPRGRQHHAVGSRLAGAIGGADRVSFRDITTSLAATMPDLRGSLTAYQPLAPFTWFRAGGPAQVMFMPADEADLALFPVKPACRADISRSMCDRASARISSLIRDGGIEGGRHPARRQAALAKSSSMSRAKTAIRAGTIFRPCPM